MATLKINYYWYAFLQVSLRTVLEANREDAQWMDCWHSNSKFKHAIFFSFSVFDSFKKWLKILVDYFLAEVGKVYLYCIFLEHQRIKNTSYESSNRGNILKQLFSGFILLTVLLTSLNCTRRQSNNNNVRICVILDFTRWWQSFTIKLSVVSTFKLTVIIRSSEYYWWLVNMVLLTQTGIDTDLPFFTYYFYNFKKNHIFSLCDPFSVCSLNCF